LKIVKITSSELGLPNPSVFAQKKDKNKKHVSSVSLSIQGPEFTANNVRQRKKRVAQKKYFSVACALLKILSN